MDDKASSQGQPTAHRREELSPHDLSAVAQKQVSANNQGHTPPSTALCSFPPLVVGMSGIPELTAPCLKAGHRRGGSISLTTALGVLLLVRDQVALSRIWLIKARMCVPPRVHDHFVVVASRRWR